jgi:hypothetical protein
MHTYPHAFLVGAALFFTRQAVFRSIAIRYVLDRNHSVRHHTNHGVSLTARKIVPGKNNESGYPVARKSRAPPPLKRYAEFSPYFLF